MNKGKKIALIIVTICLVAIGLGITYAVWVRNYEQTNPNLVETGCFEMNFVQNTAGTNNIDAIPISDVEASDLEPYSFTIKNICSITSAYSIAVEILSTPNQIDLSLIKTNIDDNTPIVLTNGKVATPTVGTKSYIIYEGYLYANQEKTHEYRQWIKEEADMNLTNEKTLNTKIVINATASEGPDIIVDLDPNMIPIMYKDNTWVVADKTNNNATYKWYDYDNKEWANAVVVNNPESYKTIGLEVLENDIKAFFVYIPRYRYQIQTTTVSSAGQEKEFYIEFETAATNKSNGTTVGSWLTHPAFTFGDRELNGIWVGKFETSYNTSLSAAITSTTALAAGVNVKPNTSTTTQYALNYMTVGEMYNTARALSGSSYYNLINNETRMLKNSEWGAIAYLSYSKYGTCTEGVCKKTQLNVQTGQKTGCGPVSDGGTGTTSACNEYDSSLGQLASTTQNIYGVYDMAGGARESVMGNYNGEAGSSGLTMANIEQKYWDKYTITANSSCTMETCGGHALFETAGWNTNESGFVKSGLQWFMRGGVFSGGTLGTGVWSSYAGSVGAAHINSGFRLSASLN